MSVGAVLGIALLLVAVALCALRVGQHMHARACLWRRDVTVRVCVAHRELVHHDIADLRRLAALLRTEDLINAPLYLWSNLPALQLEHVPRHVKGNRFGGSKARRSAARARVPLGLSTAVVLAAGAWSSRECAA